MSDNQIIREIRDSRRLSRLFDRMTVEQKRQLMAELDGDTWHILEVMVDILEDKDNATS